MKKQRSKISLSDLLRRRKTTLHAYMEEMGISTYEMLCIRCDRSGINPPSHEDFKKIIGELEVSSPTEGVVVIEPEASLEDVVDEQQGQEMVMEMTQNKKSKGKRKQQNT